MKILYVEDDPKDADLARRALKKAVPEVALDVIGTYQEAVACLEQATDYDLVLTDLKLPDGNGLSLLAHIRTLGLPCAVVVISGKGDEETAVTALKSGADDYLVKRKDYLKTLPLTLENALQRHRAELDLLARPLRVLYGEHHAADIDLTRRHLAQYAPFIRLEVVNTPPEITQRLTDPKVGEKYDVILLDYSLPGLNTLDLIKDFVQVRRVDVPVVVVTGKGSEDVAAQAIKLGAADYMVKNPGYLFQLPGLLENAFHRVQLGREQASLRASEQQYRLLFENNPLPMWIYDLETLCFLAVNDIAILKYGYSREEFLAMTLKDIRPPEDVPNLLRNVADITDTFQDSHPWRHRNKNGDVFLVEIVSHSIEYFGRPARLVMANDITERKRTEEALRTKTEELDRFFTSSLDLLCIADTDGSFRRLNPEWEKTLGYSLSELEGHRFLDFVHPDDLAATLEAVATLSSQKEILNFTNRYRCKDGSYRWIEWRSYPAGNLIYAAARDITERKRADEQIRYQADLLANVSDAIIATDMQYNIQHWNAAAETQYGWTATEVIGQPMSNFIQNEYARDSLEVVLQQISEERYWNGEMTQNRRDGTRFPVLSTVSLVKDRQGKPIGFIAVNRDITERKQAEAQIAASEAELRALFASMHDVVLVIDHDGVYRKIAPTNPALLYKPPEELLGKSLPDVFPPEQAASFLGVVRKVLKTRQTAQIEYELTVGDRLLWFSAFVTPMTEDKTVWVARDITENKQAEAKIALQIQRLNALRSIDTSIAGSFDIRVTLGIFLQHVVSQLGVDAAAILLLSPGAQTLTYAAGRGFRGSGITQLRLRVGENYAGTVALERRLISIPDLAAAKHPFTKASLTADEGFVSFYGVPLIAKGQVKGVLEIFHRSRLEPDPDWLGFLNTLAGQAAIAIDSAQSFDSLQSANMNLEVAYDATIEGWSKALDLRDKETEGHTQRVTELTLQLARLMGINEEDQIHIRRGTLLHDIGKMGIPDAVLLKPGALTGEEWVIMRQHPVFAYELLSPIAYLRPALDIPYCHHEKWDGTGYPRGLKGEQIPLAGRIFAVVDVYDALTSDRPYRKAWSKAKALKHIREQSGQHFDPQVMETFLQLLPSSH